MNREVMPADVKASVKLHTPSNMNSASVKM